MISEADSKCRLNVFTLIWLSFAVMSPKIAQCHHECFHVCQKPFIYQAFRGKFKSFFHFSFLHLMVYEGNGALPFFKMSGVQMLKKLLTYFPKKLF